MKALFIGGTGTISMSITKLVATFPEWELYLLNRGSRNFDVPTNVHIINADINDEENVKVLLNDLSFDVVGEFIGYKPSQIERDIRLFKGKTKQYIYISSASAYEKPVKQLPITEATPLSNPYWEYSRCKKACEELLLQEYKDNGFPVTIVRPAHTYDERKVPICVHGNKGSYQTIKRMIEGKPIIVPDKGESTWVMTHSEDFAKGYVGLMGNKMAIGEAFHITTDEVHTWNEIYQIIADILKVKYIPYYIPSEELAKETKYDLRGSLLGDKANSVVFDNSKIKEYVPSFICKTTLKDGMKRALDRLLSTPDQQIKDEEFDNWCDEIIKAH